MHLQRGHGAYQKFHVFHGPHAQNSPKTAQIRLTELRATARLPQPAQVLPDQLESPEFAVVSMHIRQRPRRGEIAQTVRRRCQKLINPARRVMIRQHEDSVSIRIKRPGSVQERRPVRHTQRLNLYQLAQRLS
jgi:predicted secreted protein